MEPVLWDGSKIALHQIETTMRDCLVAALDYDGVLIVKTAGGERGVPAGWWVTRTGDGEAVITREKPVA